MGMNVNDIFAQDPELIQRRIAMQEMQQLNPSGTAAGALGAVLGRGISNIQQNRGFFDVADPALRRASEMQAVFADVMQTFDPENPAASYEKLSRELAARGLAQQAATAAQEAAKIRQQAREFNLKERAVGVQEEQVNVSKEKLKMDIDDTARKNKLTDAQIKEIDARINNLAADKYSFQPQKDALGNLISVIAINKTNPSDVKVIEVAPTTQATSSTDTAAAARAELEKRRKKD